MDDSTYRQIVENALEVTVARIVALARLDSATQSVRTVAWTGRPMDLVRPALASIQRVFAGWDPSQVDYPAHANPVVEAVYLEGRSVGAPFRQFCEGSVHPAVAMAGEKMLGLKQGLLCPIMDGERVWGGMGFFGGREPSEHERNVCEAFVREASLAVEDGNLVGRVQEHVRHLQIARQQVSIAEERQRREIAELLHSRVQSNLLLLWSKVGSAREIIREDPQRAKMLLAEAQADLEVIRERDIGEASYLLHPSILRVGLVPALRSLAARVESMMHVSIDASMRVSEMDDPQNNQLPEHFRVAVFRIVEEALNNVHRHAQANRTVVSLDIETDGVLRIVIADDGKGFDPAERGRGLGLTVIDDRVEELDGTWKVVSHPGDGTSLEASLPIA